MANTPASERYLLLDAMRGVAALAVFWSHLVTSWNLKVFVAPQDFLAVDFFFILSGFVIGHAYGERMKGGYSPAKFMLIRAIRLHPLLAVGALLGTIVLLLHDRSDGFAVHSIIESGIFAAIGLPAIFIAGTPLAFPINGPAWSLYFELLANLGYAGIARFLTPLRTLAITLLSVVLLIVVATHDGTVEGGWQKAGLVEGGVRVFFGFMAGLLLHEYRPRWKAPPIVGFVLLATLALILFDPSREDVTGQLFLVLLVFPFLVWVGSAVRETPTLKRAGMWLGAISYPLYILHWPLLDPTRDLFLAIDPGRQWLPLWLFLQLAFSIGMAWAAMKFFDEPVRAYLTRRLLRRSKPTSGPLAPGSSTESA